jgi:hypothetical protein
MNPVAEILNRDGRSWDGGKPATEEQISKMVEETGFDWPEALLNLWRYSNGGEGDLDLPPMWFALPHTEEVHQLNVDCNFDGDYKDLMFFGTNGGMETIGLDIRKPNRPVFMIDLIEGIDSLEYIADDAWEFVKAIGLEYDENA